MSSLVMENVKPCKLMSRELPKDCVRYFLFVVDDTSNKCEQQKVLEEIHRAADELTNSFLEDYLWQREGFSLRREELQGRDVLCGETNFGDSIEDEWVVTFLLRELSLSFPTLWVRLEDSDGEFLLIEAAKAIPRWLSPENAENRVWINNGRLLLVSPEFSAGLKPLAVEMPLQTALEKLATRPSELLHLSALENKAFHRLKKYPNDLAENNHRALVLIPRKLAYIIHLRPASTCLAADAFHRRDPISMKALRPSHHVTRTFGPTDLVETVVKFTRVNFAQLKIQHFPMPDDWARGIPRDRIIGDADRLELGMKVAYGFELLVHDPQRQVVAAVSDILKLLKKVGDNTDCLPSDQELKSWRTTEDSDSWLDIDYNDFERNLSEASPSSPLTSKSANQGQAQDELQKMVARFKTFVEEDDSSESGSGTSSDSEDLFSTNEDGTEDTSFRPAFGKPTETFEFNEARFKDVMREWSSLSSNRCQDELSGNATTQVSNLAHDLRANAQDSDEEVERLSIAIEAELLELGALHSTRSNGLRNVSSTTASRDVHEEKDADLTLAANVLESFKCQAGLAGPGGNLMGLLGIRLPRDDADSDRTSGDLLDYHAAVRRRE